MQAMHGHDWHVRYAVQILLVFCSPTAVFGQATGAAEPAASMVLTNIFAPESTPAKSIFHLSMFVLAITAIIFVVVFTLLAYSVVKFRGRTTDVDREPAQVYGSTQIEM